MTFVRLATFALVALLIPAAAAATPHQAPQLEPLAPFEEDGTSDPYKLTSGWEFCGVQNDRIRVREPSTASELRNTALVERVSSDGIEVRGRDVVLTGGRHTIVYARVRRDGSGGQCAAVAFRIFRRVRGDVEVGELQLLQTSTQSSADEQKAVVEREPVTGVRQLFARLATRSEQRIVLPGDLYACEVEPGPIELNSDVLTLKAEAPLPAVASLKVSTSPCADAASFQHVTLTVDVSPPTDLAFGLDSNPKWHRGWMGDALALTAFVKSAELTGSAAESRFALMIDGHLAQGWRCDGDLCHATLRDTSRSGLAADVPTSASVQLVPAAIAAGAAAFNAVDGAAIGLADFGSTLVRKWIAKPSDLSVDVAVHESEVPTVGRWELPFSHPLLRLVARNRYVLSNPKGQAFAFDPGALPTETGRFVVNIEANKKGLLTHLLGQQDANGTLELQEHAELVDERTLRPLSDQQITLSIRLRPCQYTLHQLTRAYAGLANGQVLYAIEVVGDRACTTSGWTVSTADPQVTVEPQFSRFGSEEIPRVFALRIAALGPSLGNGPPIPLEIRSGDHLVAVSGNHLRVEPALSFAKPRLVTAAQPAFGVERAGPPPDGAARSSRIGIGRANWIRFDVPLQDQWIVHVEGSLATPCNPSIDALGVRAVLRERQLCVTGEESGTGVTLRADLVGEATEFALPGVSMPDHLASVPVSPGWQRVSLAYDVAPAPLPLPLDSARLICPNDTDRPIGTGEGTRAVDLANSKCTLQIPISMPEARQIEHGSLSCTDRDDVMKAVLQHYGRQVIEVRLQPVADASNTQQPTVRPIEFSVDSGLSRRDRSMTCTKADAPNALALFAIVIPIDILQSGKIKIDSYEEIDLAVVMTDASLGELPTAARNEAPRFVARLRRMPGWGTVRYDDSAYGYRLNVNAALPVGLRRYLASTGRSASSSDEYRKAEAATFGLGLIGSFEFWDFDQNESRVPFNPQFNFGVMVADDFSDTVRPSLSVVAGLGLRLPGGQSPGPGIDSHVNLFMWGELTSGARGDLITTILFGLGVNVKALGE